MVKNWFSKNSRKCFLYFLILCSLSFLGCSSTKISSEEEAYRRDQINDFYKEWKGTRYRYGGTTKKGVDCSGLVVNLYRDKFDLKLPRSSKAMAKKGDKIRRRSNWEIGDLVFFKTGWRVSHVGVYMGNNRFLHTSTKNGVIISEFDEYWNKTFWKTKRVL